MREHSITKLRQMLTEAWKATKEESAILAQAIKTTAGGGWPREWSVEAAELGYWLRPGSTKTRPLRPMELKRIQDVVSKSGFTLKRVSTNDPMLMVQPDTDPEAQQAIGRLAQYAQGGGLFLAQKKGVTKTESLNEAEDTLRKMERELRATWTKEGALAYIHAANRTRQTNNAIYYKALWETGQRPKNDTIVTFSIGLSDTYDQIITNYATAHNMDTFAAQDALGAVSNIPQRGYNAYSSRIHLAIGNAARLDLRHIEWIIKHIEGILKMGNHLKVRGVKGLKFALDRYKMLAGQD